MKLTFNEELIKWYCRVFHKENCGAFPEYETFSNDYKNICKGNAERGDILLCRFCRKIDKRDKRL